MLTVQINNNNNNNKAKYSKNSFRFDGEQLMYIVYTLWIYIKWSVVIIIKTLLYYLYILMMMMMMMVTGQSASTGGGGVWAGLKWHVGVKCCEIY